MPENYEYFKNKRVDRVYLSKSLENKQYQRNSNNEITEIIRPFRIISKVIDSAETHQFIKDGKQVSLRITNGERQEIVAKFYEDTRGIFTLNIQKYSIESGKPHNTSFTFVGNEIPVLFNFLRNVAILPIESKEAIKLDDRFVEDLVLTKEQAMQLLKQQPNLLEELLKHDITVQDVATLGHRRKQLVDFERLLNELEFFESCKTELGDNKKDEDVWQDFFEKNTWIFGYGLNYFLNSALDGQKLELVVKGYDFTGAGKRVDALLKTHGFISALSFGEIKTHKTNLLKQVQTPYRKESWQISDELSGGIAQVQRTVQVSLYNIQTKTTINNDSGDPTGEQVFMYQPRSFLVIGSLSEFQTDNGINEQKYSSFELFRRNIITPEIITFDELYQRAKFIVESTDLTR